MIRMLKFIYVAFTLLFGMLILWAPTTLASEGVKTSEKVLEEGKKDVKIVATVNGKDVTERELNQEVDKLLPRSFHNKTLKKIGKPEIFRKKALNNIIMKELMYQEAKTQKIKIDETKVDKEFNRFKSQYSQEELERILREYNVTLDNIRDYLRKDHLIADLQENMNGKYSTEAEKTVDDSYLRDYYQSNLEKFKKPERYRFREILIRVQPGSMKKVWIEAREKAIGIKERVIAGEDFAELASKFSEDDYAKDGGDMGFVHKGSLIPEIGKVVDDMHVGEIAGPIWTLYGYTIFKLEEKAPSIQFDFSYVKDKLKKDLVVKEKKRLYKDWRQSLRDNATIVIMD